MKLHWKVSVVFAILGIAALAQYWLARGKNSQTQLAGTDSTIASTTILAPSISDPSGGGYEVKSLPFPQVAAVPKMPDLDLLISAISPKNDYEKLILSHLTGARDALKTDEASYDNWLTAGMSLKQLEKYEAARDAFLYVASLWPTQPVPQGNLGSLYHLYLKDFPKSEAAYKKAIELDPAQPGWHRGLYELYRYSYKTTTNLWEETLKRGIEQTNSIDLMSVLAGRYANFKRFQESVVMYDRAIAEAEKQDDARTVDTLIGLRAAARAEIK